VQICAISYKVFHGYNKSTLFGSIYKYALSLPVCYYCYSTKARSSASIILRGANDFMLDEMERSLHDAICVVKRVLESKTLVPGGGAVEAALSIYLENFATSLVSTIAQFHTVRPGANMPYIM